LAGAVVAAAVSAWLPQPAAVALILAPEE